MYNAQFKTMFKLIAIDLMLLLVNFSYELVQQKCSDIASQWPKPVDEPPQRSENHRNNKCSGE